MSQHTPAETRPVVKRPRPVLSCLKCRVKKLKCDRLLPCQQCLKLGQPSGCTYAPGQEPVPRGADQSTESSSKKARLENAEENSLANTNQIGDLQNRVKKLEEVLRYQQASCSSSMSQESCASPLSAPPQLSRVPSRNENQVHPYSMISPVEEDFSVTSRFDDVSHFVQSMEHGFREPEVYNISAQILAIGETLARNRRVMLSSDMPRTSVSELVRHMIRLVPAVQTQNKLVELYFENFEHCLRIIHKQNFRSWQQMYNRGTMDTVQIEYFVPHLIGVLSVACILNTFPECDIPALGGGQGELQSAQLLSAWYEGILQRDGVSMTAIQVKLLAMQIQKYRNADVTSLWVSSAELIRQAMRQRLHREGLPHTNNHEAEIRRCLWLAILEQDLALAISCEMPPLCPSYDLRPPTNCNDNELSETSTSNPPDHPTHQWTDGICPHILGTTFNQRLAAYKHRFATKTSHHYDRTLELARSIELILRELPPLFRLDYVGENEPNTPSRLMAKMDLDIALRRPLIAAYAPYARTICTGRIYREARIPWVQSNLVIICFQDLFDPQYPVIDVPRPAGYWDFFYTAYRQDVIRSLDAMVLEADFYKRATPKSPDGSNNVDVSAEASVIKVKPWDFEAMSKSIEDTLDPMKRRIGSSEVEDLRTIVKYTILYECIKAPIGSEAAAYIVHGLQGLASDLTQILEHEGLIVSSGTERQSSPPRSSKWLVEFLGLQS